MDKLLICALLALLQTALAQSYPRVDTYVNGSCSDNYGITYTFVDWTVPGSCSTGCSNGQESYCQTRPFTPNYGTPLDYLVVGLSFATNCDPAYVTYALVANNTCTEFNNQSFTIAVVGSGQVYFSTFTDTLCLINSGGSLIDLTGSGPGGLCQTAGFNFINTFLSGSATASVRFQVYNGYGVENPWDPFSSTSTTYSSTATTSASFATSVTTTSYATATSTWPNDATTNSKYGALGVGFVGAAGVLAAGLVL